MGLDIKQTQTGGIQLWDGASGGQNAIKQSMCWAVARGATNTVVVGRLPANAIITRVDVIVPIASDAGTTANVSVGLDGGSATFFTAAQDVKAAIGTFSQTAKATWIQTAKQVVNCTYTETGTASTVGTFFVSVDFVVN